MNGYAAAEAARLELAQGEPGPAFASLLYRLTAAICFNGPYPPPSRGPRWTTDDVVETANDFLAHRRTERRLATILVQSTDGKSFQGQLAAAIRNYLRDKGRDTDRGHLIGRLRDVLDGDSRFEPGPGPRTWKLAGQGGEAHSGSTDDLVEAAYTVSGVSVIRWNSRRGPVATATELARLLEVVLARAGGAVTEAVLSEVVERRLGLALDASIIPFDDMQESDEPPGDQGADLPAEAADLAGRIWDQLTVREREVLVFADLDVRSLGERIGLRKSAAHEARDRLATTLRTVLSGIDDGERVYEVLRTWARRWLAGRTTQGDSPSVTYGPGTEPHRSDDRREA